LSVRMCPQGLERVPKSWTRFRSTDAPVEGMTTESLCRLHIGKPWETFPFELVGSALSLGKMSGITWLRNNFCRRKPQQNQLVVVPVGCRDTKKNLIVIFSGLIRQDRIPYVMESLL